MTPGEMSPAQLLTELREVLMALGQRRLVKGQRDQLNRQAVELEAEIERRMSW